MQQPADIHSFMAQINTLALEREKAASMLFSDIENDVNDKQAFLIRQGESIEQMVNVYRTLIIKLNVFRNADSLLSP